MKNKYREYLGKNIRYFRKLNNLSIEKLAEKSNLSTKYLSTVELGQNNISFDNIISICNALEIEPYNLLEFPNNDKDKLKQKLISIISNDNIKMIKLYLKIIEDIKKNM